ncbi:group 3 secretory phospholipase A2 isoform X1 [Salmo trutta]|uniref:group 3 secretory phospholipase A2 isoform X1 n=2 Tax=Salmo trutta TaxID=8032 RepID=UPI0011304873|nr:group 3 secretory phospholipase A2-like isoform X1 [Salmo trutta]
MINKRLLQFALCLSLLSLQSAQYVKMSAGTDAQNANFCHRTSFTGLGHTRLSFLRNMIGTHTLMLYVSEWSEKQLVKCSINDDPVATASYLYLCRQTRSESLVELSLFNIRALLSPDNLCSLSPVDGFIKQTKNDPLEQQHISGPKSRRKRAWVFPGTLWCGTGSKAIDYKQLGMFERADRCCREHDHCSNTIPSFTVNYGVFNPNFFTISHCDCDQRFRQCLQRVNDTISSMVGFSFFNLLKMPCFEFTPRSQCTELNWWGMCKVAKVAPYAVFKNPKDYTINRMTSKHGGSSDPETSAGTGENLVTVKPLSSPTRLIPKGNRSKLFAPSRDCVPTGPPRGDTFQLKHRKGKGCSRGKKTFTTQTTTSQTQTSTPLIQTTASLISRSASQKQKTTPTTQRTASKMITTTSQVKIKKTSTQKTGSRTEKTISHQNQATPNKKARSRQRTSSTTMQRATSTPKPSPHPQTTLTTTTLIPKSPKLPKVLRKLHRCGPPRGDTFQPRRWRGERGKACLEQITKTPTTISSANKTASPTQRRISQTQRTMPSNKRTTSATVMTSSTLWKNTITKRTASSKLRTTPLIQTPTESAPSMTTDNMLLCGTLKHLDECKYKIHPLEKRYDLHNMGSKTVYHCDCTHRLADQIRHLEKTTILQSLLQDFVSLSCFNVTSVKDCHGGKSCTAGFSQATDLIQVLKSMEERGRLNAQSTSKDSKRGTPIRLYKRCLRIIESKKP